MKKVNYNIPNNSEEYYIPITIINGEGEVLIESLPILDTAIEIDNAEILDVFDKEHKYIAPSFEHFIKEEEEESNIIYFENTIENKNILKDAKEIKLEGISLRIIGKEEEEKYIKLQIDSNVKELKEPNYVEVIK